MALADEIFQLAPEESLPPKIVRPLAEIEEEVETTAARIRNETSKLITLGVKYPVLQVLQRTHFAPKKKDREMYKALLDTLEDPKAAHTSVSELRKLTAHMELLRQEALAQKPTPSWAETIAEEAEKTPSGLDRFT